MKYLLLVAINLRRKKLRTVLTLLSILVAFLLYGYLGAIEVALGQGVEVAGADRLVVRHRVSIVQPLPLSYGARISRLAGVEDAMHASWFGGVYQDPRNFFAQIPVEPDRFQAMYPEYVLPAEQAEAWRQTRTGAIVGRRTAVRFGWKIGDRIPIQAPIWQKKDGGNTWEFDLVGIYDGRDKGTDTTTLYLRYDYFDESRSVGEGLVGWYVARVKDPEQAEAVARAIDAEFANSPAETKTETEGAFAGAFARQIGDVGRIMRAILGAVFFTILLVAGNTMALSVRERTSELGVLKALGFSSRQVMAMVLAESGMLALAGACAGLGLAWFLVGRGDPTGMLPVFYVPGGRWVAGLALAAGLGLVAGLLPAVQAMRLRITDALRRA